MILKASERGGAKQLYQHLTNTIDNDHVELHDIRGFVSDNAEDAFQEMRAISLGTQCKKFMFSLALNPPLKENVAVSTFMDAIHRVENQNGLGQQARLIYFHEKNGRRHCHAVWSRIDVHQMKAINLSFYKNKLQEISKQLYIENGWKMPDGYRDKALRNPLNFTLSEWQQSKRTKQDPKTLKTVLQECWNISDSQKAFASSLFEHGLILAKGDRRGFVVVDHHGEVYAIARSVGIKTKDVRAKLDKPDDLPSVAEAKQQFSEKMTDKLKGFIADLEKKHVPALQGLETKRQKLTHEHRVERQRLNEKQTHQQIQDLKIRSARLRKGIRGAWDWLTGQRAKIKSQNSLETFWAFQRDQKQKQDLIQQQLTERRIL